MNKLKFFGKPFLVGVDIGSSSIKLVQLTRRETSLTLNQVRIKEIGKEPLAALKEILKGLDLSQTQFIVACNCPETAIRVFTVPWMPKGELKEAIRYEAKNYFPFPVDDCAFDFELIGEIQEKEVKKYRVMVAASPLSTVNEIIALFKKAGVTPFSLIPTPCALEKLVRATRQAGNKIECLVDIGERYTELLIFKGRDLIFSRKVPVAGLDFTRAMTGVLVSDRGRTALSLEEAEKIKRSIGIPSSEGESMIEGKITTSQILSVLHSPLEQLTSEVNRCFDYDREAGGGKVDSIVLFGGGSQLKGLTPFLSEEWGLPVRLGNPLEGLRAEAQLVNPEEGLGLYATALGAALSEGRGINLLPTEIKDEIRRALRRATLQSAAVTVIFLMAFIYIGMRIQLGNFQKRIEVARLERESLRLELERVAEQSVVHQVLADEPYWEDVLRELSNAVPSTLYLTQLEMNDQIMTIKGVIASADREGILTNFIRDLESGIFKAVKLVSSRERADKLATEFELQAGLD